MKNTQNVAELRQQDLPPEALDRAARSLWAGLRAPNHPAYPSNRLQWWDQSINPPVSNMVRYKCPKCCGTGRVMVFKEPTDRCYRCDGQGSLSITKRAWTAKQARRKAILGAMEGMR